MRAAQAGDTVTLTAKVHHVADSGHLHVQFPDQQWDTRVPAAAVVSVEHAPLRVGDVVTWGDRTYSGPIKAIVGHEAWVELITEYTRGPKGYVRLLTDLTRVGQ